MIRAITPTICGLSLGFVVAVSPASSSGPLMLLDPDCRKQVNQRSADMKCVFQAMFGPGAGSTDPVMCRFGSAEADGPVLLAAKREDCSRAGGAVMTSTAENEAADR
jgi:hypothetical protein